MQLFKKEKLPSFNWTFCPLPVASGWSTVNFPPLILHCYLKEECKERPLLEDAQLSSNYDLQ